MHTLPFEAAAGERLMIAYLSKLPIRVQVLTALLVAIVALVGLSSVFVADRWSARTEIGKLSVQADAVAAIGQLSHELQKERGASALFIGSEGKQFAAELADQRRAADTARDTFARTLAPLQQSATYKPFLERLADAQDQLNILATRRGDVDRLAIKGPDSFAYYTRLIAGLLNATYEITRATADADLKGLIFSYTLFLQGKERAGQERATGSAGFAAARFDLPLYQRLLALQAGQDTYFATFRSVADAALVDTLDRELNGSVSDEVQRLRAVAINGGPAGDLQGIVAPAWFKATTGRIDRMKVVEDRIALTLRAAAAAKADRATFEFSVVLAVALTGSLLALVVGVSVVRSIARTLGGLTAATQAIASGNVHVQIPGDDRSDELGALARAIHAIRTAGVAAMRVKTALDNVSGNVMMADIDGRIIYANRAVMAMFRTAETDIRKQMSHFDVSRLVGSQIDIWHKDPDMQRRMLAQLKDVHRARIKVGRRRFELVATPVIDDAGQRHGTAVEWHDITVELEIQEEVATLVRAAGQGDFSRRIVEDGKTGFMLDLARGMNALASTSASSLHDVVTFLDALASGNLTGRISGDHHGMFGKIKDDANRTAERLSDIVSRIVSASDTIGVAAAEIATGSSDLADRTEQQASSLEETAAAMEELGATVRASAEKAQSANSMSSEARAAAENGGAVTGSAIEAMRRIEESSRKITDIIGVIDEIAFQTNLLALNAAVEAARAGDAGRGFAVVAQEVRTLAQRSAQASKEIKTLILDSDGQVKDGVELVRKAGTALGRIVSSVKEVATLISDMATASGEQATALDEINSTVAQMDEMTQKNAALVEETTAAAQSLASQASDMRSLMSFFRS
jgi:methyl-accepting chemotaxis protein